MIYVELLIQGVLLGAIYALMAIGLTLVYGLLRILHIAHAAILTLGAYATVIVTNATGSLAVAVAAAALVCGMAGVLIYQLAYRPIIDRPLVALVASIGIYIALEELYRLVFGPYSISFEAQPLDQRLSMLGFSLTAAELVTILGTTVLILSLAALLGRSRLGTAWRASVTAPQIAVAFGVDLEHVRRLNFLVASILAACAGAMVAILNNVVEPTMGFVPGYKALAVIVLGGLGNVRGTLAAAILLGIIEAYGTIYLGSVMDRDAIAFAFLVIVLLFRPAGLFSKAAR